MKFWVRAWRPPGMLKAEAASTQGAASRSSSRACRQTLACDTTCTIAPGWALKGGRHLRQLTVSAEPETSEAASAFQVRRLFSRKSTTKTSLLSGPQEASKRSCTARSSRICACCESCALIRQWAQAAMRRGPKRSLVRYHSTKGPGRLSGYSNFQRAWTTELDAADGRPQATEPAAACPQAGYAGTMQLAEGGTYSLYASGPQSWWISGSLARQAVTPSMRPAAPKRR